MPADLPPLSPEDEREAAWAKLLRCVSACEQSSERMRRKLSDAGFSEAAIASALERAQRVGAVDDVRYAECLVRSNALAGKGMEFAKREVARLGICIEDLESYQEYLDAGEEAQIEAACDILSRHPSRAKDKRGAAFRKLLAKGYSMDMASKAVSRWMDIQEVGV